jgi:hypothetical protein
MRNLSIKSFENYSPSKWDDLITDFDVTINYTAWFISYVEVLNSKNNIKNLSFFLLEDNEIVAIAPLYVEQINGKYQISMGQEPIYAPIVRTDADASSSLAYCQYILKEIEAISRKFRCALARFHFSPLLTENMFPIFFKELGYTEEILHPDWYIFKSKNSYIINLDYDENDLYSSVRKSNKPHINRTRRETELVILDEYNFDQSIFDQYIQFYYKVKGNKRSQRAFLLDKSAIKKGLEVILLCKFMDKFIGAVALHTHNGKARYNSSIQDYDFDKKIYPNHFLLWEAILYLKAKGFSLFEIGEQVDQSSNLTIKEKNLSHFKAGWGGRLVPWIKVQKEFDNA